MNVEDRAQRALTAAVFGVGLFLGALIPAKTSLMVPVAIVIGLGIPAVAKWLWGERARPKVNGFWLLAGPVGLVVAGLLEPTLTGQGLSFFFPLSLLVGFFLVHDLPLTPSLMVTAGVIGAVVHMEREFEWTLVPEGKVWWVALCVLITLIAALLERDRLSRRQGVITPAMWSFVRIGFLSGWTLLAILARESLQIGRLFESFGIDAATDAGRMMLLAILALCILVVAVAFRRRKTAAPGAGQAEAAPPATSK